MGVKVKKMVLNIFLDIRYCQKINLGYSYQNPDQKCTIFQVDVYNTVWVQGWLDGSYNLCDKQLESDGNNPFEHITGF